MHMMRLNYNGFDVTYGKERNGPYSARIYPTLERGTYLNAIKWITGCNTKEEILLCIGFEVCDLIKSEVDPTIPFRGNTQVLNYSEKAQ